MNILIADDHPLYRMALSGLLAQLDSETSIVDCSDFNELQDIMASNSPKPDLVVMDIRMPGMLFEDALSGLKTDFPDIPVVVVSASENIDDMSTALNLGAEGFIPKSSSRDVLISAIRLVLSGGKYFPFQVFTDQQNNNLGRQSETSSKSTSASKGPDLLTRRQRNVLDLMAEGQSNKEIAEELKLAESTVKVHITAIFRTLGVSNRTQAVLQAKEFA
jgi:DNA-binding NarL/FixJ family response regulator